MVVADVAWVGAHRSDDIGYRRHSKMVPPAVPLAKTTASTLGATRAKSHGLSDVRAATRRASSCEWVNPRVGGSGGTSGRRRSAAGECSRISLIAQMRQKPLTTDIRRETVEAACAGVSPPTGLGHAPGARSGTRAGRTRRGGASRRGSGRGPATARRSGSTRHRSPATGTGRSSGVVVIVEHPPGPFYTSDAAGPCERYAAVPASGMTRDVTRDRCPARLGRGVRRDAPGSPAIEQGHDRAPAVVHRDARRRVTIGVSTGQRAAQGGTLRGDLAPELGALARVACDTGRGVRP